MKHPQTKNHVVGLFIEKGDVPKDACGYEVVRKKCGVYLVASSNETGVTSLRRISQEMKSRVPHLWKEGVFGVHTIPPQ